MPRLDLVIESEVSRSPRARQLEGMFDVPSAEKQRLEWKADLPLDAKPWNVGLVVGPSGCGKSTVARKLFGSPRSLDWSGASCLDDFRADLSMEDITRACSAVGFNTIPAWLRPFRVLSTGEQFRAEVARLILETKGLVVIDEFTSVVDRQVAKIASHAVQKYVRRQEKQLVACSCHYDILDWLQPDWTFEPATLAFQWRCLQRRPSLRVEIARVHHEAWRMFAPFHYMTAELHRAATCFVLFVEGKPAAFCGVLHRPISRSKSRVAPIKGNSRTVTLPDYQGLGLAFVLTEKLGAAYKALGYRFHNYPAHPSFIRSHDKSPQWAMLVRPGFHNTRSRSATLCKGRNSLNVGGRPNAVFKYVGPALSEADARALLDDVRAA